jgi:glutathione S-transferase
MADYLLHCFAQSGNAYKPALALELAQADWAPRFVDYFNGETKSPAYRAMNVMGEVPMLEHPRRRVVPVGRHPRLSRRDARPVRPRQSGRAPRDPALAPVDNHKLTSYTATYRYMRTFVKEPETAVLDEFRRRAETRVGLCSTSISSAGTTSSENGLTIADISLAGISTATTSSAPTGAPFRRCATGSARIRASRDGSHPYELMPGHPRT